MKQPTAKSSRATPPLLDLIDLVGEEAGAAGGDLGAVAADAQRLIDTTGLGPDDRFLDMGCGDGRVCLELARRGYRSVAGAERSRHLIRMARRAAQQTGLAVRFLERDTREFLPRDGRFDCAALLDNRFSQFEPDDALAVLEAVKRVLRPSGQLVLEITDGAWVKSHFEKSEWRFIDNEHLICRERSLSGEGDRLICRDVLVHTQKGVVADRFYSLTLLTADRVHELLLKAGFVNLRERGGDEHTTLFLAEMQRAKTAETPPLRPTWPDVTIILGDPRLSDTTKIGDRYTPEDLDAVERMKVALATLANYRFTYVDDHTAMLASMIAHKPDFVFNMCDNGYKNDALRELEVPALLDLVEVPYTGAGPTCLGMCYDKSLVRAVAVAHGVPVPRETYFDMSQQTGEIPSMFPALIKPNRADGSVGITAGSVVNSAEEALVYLNHLRKTLPGRDALIQEYLTGTEYSMGLIGNPGLGFTVLPPLEVDYSGLDPSLPRILSYESKFDPSSPYFTEIKYKRAGIPETVRRRLADYSRILFERLDCRDYARFDFRSDSAGEIKLLEVNPNPAWCWDGKLAMMAGFAGYSYADLLRMILEAAQARVLAEGLARSEAAKPALKAVSG
jgi:D-alanine-D-alanine ligase